MKRICTVCARGGSKEVPDKNIRAIAGKPLMAYTIEQGVRSGLFDTIAVTSDSDKILKIAKEWGATILVTRPEELAADAAPKLPAIKHCVEEAERVTNNFYDTICDLDPTSPFRTVADIRNCVRLLEEKGASNVITAAIARKSPYFNLVEIDEKGFAKLSKPDGSVARRQDSPKCFDMNASIYVWKREIFFKSTTLFNGDTLLYEMPRERSVEIDTEFDLEIASFLMEKKDFCGRAQDEKQIL